MRMRKKKHGAERLAACRGFLVDCKDVPLTKERISKIFGAEREVWLEIGAGKGGFAVEMARKNPNVAYIAMEKVSDCVVLAAESARAAFGEDSCNLRFIIETADNLTRILPRESVSRIFLNFSDPWSKKGYAKRRLTHSRYLALYMNLLKDGGILQFKTDNEALFDFSLEEISKMGLIPSLVTRDLHTSPYNEGNVMTEYERAFSSQGIRINMLRLLKPEGFMPKICDELRDGRKRYIQNDGN